MSNHHPQEGDTKKFFLTGFLSFAIVFSLLLIFSTCHGPFHPVGSHHVEGAEQHEAGGHETKTEGHEGYGAADTTHHATDSTHHEAVTTDTAHKATTEAAKPHEEAHH